MNEHEKDKNEWPQDQQKFSLPLVAPSFADSLQMTPLSKRLVIEGRDIPTDKDHFRRW